MRYLGCHLSASKGFLHMGKEALSIGANTFQFFTRNPRGAQAKAMDPADAAALMQLMQEHAFGPIVAHAPYTMNPCSADPGLRELAEKMMTDDLERMAFLPGNLYNFHPGSHVGQGVEVGIEQIAALLNRVLRPEQRTTVLLETMAGKGSEVGSTFEELRKIIDLLELDHLVGVCLDTCHVSDKGYALRDSLDAVLEEFDRVVGIGRLKAVHLNDSMNAQGSHKDRHAKIGEGTLGVEALACVINHPALRGLSFCLETPNELPGYAQEIELLRGLARG